MPYSYAMYGYAGYAKHGYVAWLCHCGHVGYAKFGYATWLRRLRQTWLRHIVTPRCYAAYATVTPNSVTPYGYVAYAKHGYAT